ncbi:testis-expressed protein 11-like [Dysidea avara]|uniref:testis-expressed protein 11-like n=1 Tax=Dysidea avara TaxID=196820 RepID=UPI003332B41B
MSTDNVKMSAEPPDKLAGLLTAIQDLTTQLSTNGGCCSELASRVVEMMEVFPPLDQSNRHTNTSLQLHTMAITLWNLAVTMKTKDNTSNELNAQLRYIACSLVFRSSSQSTSSTTVNKQLTMAIKTGRAWMECSNYTMAETSLNLATECWERMTRLLGEKARSNEDHAKMLFKLLCLRSETALKLSNHKQAFELVSKAKEILKDLSKEAGYLSMLCYNFGVETFQEALYEHSVQWLRESYELGKSDLSFVVAKKQARTLRLLANAYLEWDVTAYWQKALNAVGLANSEHAHPSGLYLKCSILLRHDPHDVRLPSVMEETLSHTELTLDLALSTIRLAAQHKRLELAFSGLQQLLSRYQSSHDLSKVQLLQLELLLENGQVQESCRVVEQCITAHHSGSTLELSVRKRFHWLLWEQAANAYENGDYTNSLMWYNYSLSLFSTDQVDSNLAKLQRNRCSCFIMIGDNDKAEEAIQVALKSTTDNPHTHFLAFKLALVQGDTDKAMESIAHMSSCDAGEDSVHGLVCLAAQLAFEKSNRVVAIKALEHLVETSQDIQQSLTALRCLARLKLTFISPDQKDKMSGISCILNYTNTALAKLQKGVTTRGPVGTSLQDEVTWFMKVSWNVALLCGDPCQEMYQLFLTCYKLSELGGTKGDRARQKTCLLMASAISLQLARDCKDETEQVKLLEQVLDHISQCKEICKKMLTESGDGTWTLLGLYEYEAQLRLHHYDELQAILDHVSSQPNVELKTLETMAALACDTVSGHKPTAVTTLKMAINKHMQRDNVDYAQCSKAYHSLVQLLMQREASRDMAGKEQAWQVFVEALNCISECGKGEYPEMEVLWLLTKAWNCGVHLYSTMHYKEAEQWCSLSMKLLQHLTTLRASYEAQMTSVYGEILSKLQSGSLPTCTL